MTRGKGWWEEVATCGRGNKPDSNQGWDPLMVGSHASGARIGRTHGEHVPRRLHEQHCAEGPSHSLLLLLLSLVQTHVFRPGDLGTWWPCQSEVRLVVLRRHTSSQEGTSASPARHPGGSGGVPDVATAVSNSGTTTKLGHDNQARAQQPSSGTARPGGAGSHGSSIPKYTFSA